VAVERQTTVEKSAPDRLVDRVVTPNIFADYQRLAVDVENPRGVNSAGPREIPLTASEPIGQSKQHLFGDPSFVGGEINERELLANELDAGFAAEAATAGDCAETLRARRGELHCRRQLGVDRVLIWNHERFEVCAVADDRLGHQKSRGEFVVLAGCAHRRRDCLITDPDFQWFFDRDLVGDAFVTSGRSANDASSTDSLHARSSHENEWKKRMTFAALLLAGGESRRMGRDKATIQFGSQPLWERQLQVLRALGPERIFVSARTTPAWLPDYVELLLDDLPSRGPLSGLTKALVAMGTTHLVVLAVDLPFMIAEELNRSLELATGNCGVVPTLDGRFEPLAAVYPADALADFQRGLAGSDFSLQSVVRELVMAGKVKLRPVPEALARLYQNWNEPGDVEDLPRIGRPKSVDA
jgi:molybdenum cofactor guanylyltransferase